MKLQAGLYDHLLTERLRERIETATAKLVELGKEEAAEYLAGLVARELRVELRGLEEHEQIARVNGVLADEQVVDPAQVLQAIYGGPEPPLAPTTPLGQSGLILNAADEPRLGFELEREMASAEEVWMLVSFIQWRGWQRLRLAMEGLARDKKPVSVLTTTYMGASDLRALEAMAALPNVEMRISMDGSRRRLHAKAWLFVRSNGLSSAYVGSANLSGPALEDGIEWTVKMSEREAPHVIEKFRGAFDSYWNGGEFEVFEPGDGEMRQRLAEALAAGQPQGERTGVFFDLKPHAYQQATLDALEAQRLDLGRWRNLVVAPTGTGKTLIAAFDYARQAGPRPRLLFLAHREELLRQARVVYRHVLRDESFGELLVGGESPRSYEHLFATIQSVGSRQIVERMGGDYWQYVVLDEAHHAPAESYREVMDRLRPGILLGLTATPERMDGESILPWFGGETADEMRLWHAIERQYLVPFDYYGVSDGTDLREVGWNRGRYEVAGLREMLSQNERRAQVVIAQFCELCGDVRQTRALAFCVDIAHARFMAEMFARAGIAAEAVTSDTPEEARRSAPQRLRDREVNVLLTVDLYNEGVDLPSVDTILFLRPTESATVFLQQLGRGLRLAPGKQSCLVIDFIGNQRREFRFDTRFRALFGGSRREVTEQLETGVTRLPGNCYFRLDREAQRVVLENLRQRLETRRSRMVEEVRELGRGLGRRPRLGEFLQETSYELGDVYKDTVAGWTGLLRDAGLVEASELDLKVSRQLKFLLHWDSLRRMKFYLERRPARDGAEQRMALMLTQRLLQGRAAELATGPESGMELLRDLPAVGLEFEELVEVLRSGVRLHREEKFWREDWPLSLHRSYTLDEVLAAVGYKEFGSRKQMREGVLWLPEAKAELLFVKLDKSGKSFSPTTRYEDYAVSPTLFHWQSQSRTRVESAAGQRYVRQAELGLEMLLFVQEKPGGAYVFLGNGQYQSHHGERPMNVLWRLGEPMPSMFYEVCASFRAA